MVLTHESQPLRLSESIAMAPLPESRKRPGSIIENHDHSLKRQKRYYHHNHSTQLKQRSAVPNILNDPLSIEHQLRRAIALVVRAAGWSDATPEALNSFTSLAEEYMDHLLRYVRMSMEAGKRSAPTSYDFEYALNANHLIPASLVVHLDPPTSDKTETSEQLVAPDVLAQGAVVNKDEQLMEQFSIGLRGPEMQKKLPYAARRLPTLPSRHTYSATYAASNRAQDAKSIRERATEESRLGEEALRRLVSAAQGNGKTTFSNRGQPDAQTAYQRCFDMLVEQGQEDEDRVDLKRTDFSGPPVNADSRYWRKGITPMKKPAISAGARDPG